jgi:alkylation response protein AidB-like acyl-CoA dehydrogenase
MPSYTPPLRDIRFVLDDVLGMERITALPGHADATPDVTGAVLEEAGRFAAEVIFPLNQSGDAEGCVLENGVVRTPKGFKEAYDRLVAGGWPGLACATEWGGQGLPKVLNVVLEELFCSANLSFAIVQGLSHGAYGAIEAYADERLKQLYLPKLAEGTWSGTMCLTEPQCGTDLGLIRTRAEPAGDRTYKISGTKIFISCGEQDLTENIVHLVLARLQGAPAGIRGISLFLVPKFLPKEEGGAVRPGRRNSLACGSIEHKMGIKASPTCVMNFDGATGWLVGEPHKGMRAMFVMMNAARLGVGMQGLALSEVAYQNAAAYARERLQGRSLAGAKFPDRPADPIIVHPDVRRNLLTMRAFNEAARALAYWIGMEIDVAGRHPDPAERQAAGDVVALMTPIIKAWFTDMGHASANLGMQVLGGHGYIREWGMEQYARDARIPQIYEGANGIQALDLVGRKLPEGTGRLLRRFFHPVDRYIAERAADPAMAEFVGPLARAFGKLQQATAWVARMGLKDPEEAGAASTDYLRLFALVAAGWMWARMVEAARAKAAAGDADGFCAAKVKTARFFFQRMLPETNALFITVTSGKRSLMDLEAEAF